MTLLSFISTFARLYPVCMFLFLSRFETINPKVYILLENLDQLTNLKIDFIFVLKLLIDVCSN